MATKLQEVLTGKEENYILPFFWQHGEEEEVLRDEMARIYESGIRAVCIESRPHPDFLGPKWWKDIDVILDEARTRGMRVWILDDDHFPTGHAAGRLKEAPRELRRLYIYENHLDAVGPRDNSAFMVSNLPYMPGFSNGGTLFAVIAVKRDPVSGEMTDESIDLTDQVENGKLYWNVPDGYWRIFSLIESEHGGDPEKKDYINHLVADSVRVLINTVYEAFYERYHEDFGKTLAGFFSDEPGFYNDKDTWDFSSKPGKKGVTLPWCTEMFSLLEQEFGPDYRRHLPLLWYKGGESTSRIRFAYMNLVSKLYGENFTEQIGNWCREREVEYIGHVLEDNNVHARLGSGTGHFYRALGGQDMSGLDVVLWQLKPGVDEIPTKGFAGEIDSEFFNYGMAKMAVSLAHIDPKKKGRTMAEVFGAYGWAEGLKLMKWLTDHMLVRGVNHFVPHAFSPKDYPDQDCPPHLYAGGKNPQYRYYRILNQYTNRLSHLLSGGTHVATAAVLYHAEAEWSGEFMYFHKPVKELLRNQIDCDILPCDTILNGVSVRDSKLHLQNETYHCLIVPYSEALPNDVLHRMNYLAEQGLPIFFIEGLPSRSSEGSPNSEILDRLAADVRVEVVPLDKLVDRMKASAYYDVQVKSSEPFLRCYHVKHLSMEVFMFFNEHPAKDINTEVILPVTGCVQFYDAYTNQVLKSECVKQGNSSLIRLNLAKSETIVVIAGSALDGIEAVAKPTTDKLITAIEGPWNVYTATSQQYPTFTPWREMGTLSDLSRTGLLPTFSGTIRYETDLNWSSLSGKQAVMDIGEAFETVEVYLNGVSSGIRLTPPYRFDLSGLVREGRNKLAIEVTNTLVFETPDFFSRLGQLEPSGLLGPVRLYGE
ncbi:glycosyl transferase family 2 [Paenibacillus sp. JNUCC31]|uniref:glycosylhydrolase-like jelly roll fold domain-containing protein n=1 Tax=Paenibacillus sp. JNUCC-31 TaxID=2777983 RepID=UPI001783DDAE|nr:glycosylhydrolase-like jelly roll fold domain-containing protein [Paenibacillus sp. JNUCC-31]QOS79414.1 glycosyl transferase family 2 [Paenibacillus sp. JNUCC-31]